jgi:hypothetical protein
MFDVERFVNLMGVAIERNARGRKKFEEAYTKMASPAQLAKIEKANKLGWYVSYYYIDDKRVVLRNNSNKAEMVIDFNGKVIR